ncbi:MAG: glycosyl transferase [Shewanella oneidensis]|nr:MAG: glycosyl transferase [Shewanella oneidensis]
MTFIIDDGNPMVSIITPCFNSSKWLPLFFEQIRRQTLKNWELIIVDDCSVDDSYNLSLEFALKDCRVKVFKLDSNSGPSVARNFGLNKSSGRFIAFLDTDDLWHPSKLLIQVSWMKSFSIPMSYHDYRHISYDSKFVGRKVQGPDFFDWVTLHKRRGIGCLTVMFDRHLCNLPTFPEDSEGYIAEDLVAWLNVLKTGVVARRLPLTLGYYRLSVNSRSSNKLKAVLSVFFIYRKLENLSLPKTIWFMLNYMIHSFFIHRFSRPSYNVEGLDYIDSIEEKNF